MSALSWIPAPQLLLDFFFEVLDVFPSIVVSIVVIPLVILIIRVLREREIKSLTWEFMRLVRVDADVLALPERAIVEKGIVRIKHHLESSGRYTTYHTDISLFNSTVVETNALRTLEICSDPFYILIERPFLARFGEPVNMYLVAPGFIVRSGRFEGIVGLCINPDSIPSRRLEIRLNDPPSEGVGVVELGKSSIKATVAWNIRTPITHKVIYDEKTGVYRVGAQPCDKGDIRGVRVEICFPAVDHYRCITVAKTTTPNTSSTGEVSWKIKNRILLYIHSRLTPEDLIRELRKIIEFSEQEGALIAGYAPREMKAKLVIDRPFRKDLVQESMLQQRSNNTANTQHC